MSADAARVIIEVVAGVIPGHPEDEYTKRFGITAQQWEEAGEDGKANLLAERNGQAQGYAGLLMLQPDRFNWVRTEWIWP